MTLASKSTMSPFEAARCAEAYVQRIEDCTVAMCLLDTEACPAILIAARSPAKCKKCYGSNEHGGMHCEGFWGVLHAFMETLLRLRKTSPWQHSAWPPGLRKLPITSLSGSCDSLTSTSHWSDGLATEKVFGIQSIEKHAEHVERASIGISINRMIAVPGWPALWKHIGRSSPQRRAPSSASDAIAAVDASPAPAQGFGRHSVRKLKPRLGRSQMGAKSWQTRSDSCLVVEAPTILDRVVQAAWPLCRYSWRA